MSLPDPEQITVTHHLRYKLLAGYLYNTIQHRFLLEELVLKQVIRSRTLIEAFQG